MTDLTFGPKFFVIFLLLAIWNLTWKGIALWKAVKRNQKKWFIAILILNTFGVLEMIYIFIFSKKKRFPKLNNVKT